MLPIRLHKTVGVKVGPVQVGGGAPVAVQSMTNTDTPDVESTARQCIELAQAGSELVRITVNLPEAAAAVPAIKQRMLDAGVTAPLIGDFHYNGHILLTKHPRVRESARQVPDQSGQRRHRQAARRAVHDHLPGRGRSRQARTHRRQWRLPESGARHEQDAGKHRPRTWQELGRDHQRVHGAVRARLDGARARVGPPQESDHHLVQSVAAASSHRGVSRAREAYRSAAAPRLDRSRHGHQRARLVCVGNGCAAERRHRRHDSRLADAAPGRRSPRRGVCRLRDASSARAPFVRAQRHSVSRVAAGRRARRFRSWPSARRITSAR